MNANLAPALLDPGVLHSRPGTPLAPRGLCLHSTATPGADARRIRAFFNGPPGRDASAHFAVDDLEILVLVPVSEMAWGAGPTSNRLHLHLELCEFDDPARFQAALGNWVWLAATLCLLFGWEVEDGATVCSHQQVSARWRETDHTDPLPLLARHGLAWLDVVARIAAATGATPL